jgi:putative beta barrel porin BBP7
MRKKFFAIATALLAGAGIAQAQQTTPPPATGLTPNSPNTNPQSPGSALLQPNNGQPTPSQGTVDGWGNPSCPNCTSCACQDACKIHGWLAADYLLFFPDPQRLPANLVTTGGVQTVGTTTNFPIPFAFRLDTGMWWDPEQNKGTQTIVDTVFRSETTTNFGAGSTINTNGGANAFTITGASTYQTWSQFGDSSIDMLRKISSNDNTRIYAIYGTKIAYEEEDAAFNYVIGRGVGNLGGGANFLDEFHTRNGFFGGDLGMMVKSNFGNFTADFAARCALGINYTSSTTIGTNNATVAVAGTGGAAVGANTQVFTNDNNIGYREAGYFSVIPALNANLAYNFSERLSVRIGYTFIAWTNVERAGDQINPTLAPIAGIGGIHTAPAFPSATTTLLIQGVNFGATLKF